MKKLIFKIDKKIDFRNHLIQMNWRDKTGFKFSEKDLSYFNSLENIKDIQEQWKEFKKYSADFYSDENKDNINEILNSYQKSWDEVEDIYIKKMEDIHKQKFPYESVFGVLSTSPGGWGFNFNEDEPWFACPNKIDKKFIKVAMHEIMHGFFIEYFREKYKKDFNLNDNQLWDVQESLTILLNIELGDILPEPDMGYPQHQELREEVKETWLETRDISKILNHICEIVKK
ncbi:hypothetical protein KKC45_02380 [Patescibacteria group bacterium]|nr:hypothetical protein [Patescibacteria group bacterium]